MKKVCLSVFFAVLIGWALQPVLHAQFLRDPLAKIEGKRYTCIDCNSDFGETWVLDVRNGVLINGQVSSDGQYRSEGTREQCNYLPIRNYEITCDNSSKNRTETYTISKDGLTITSQFYQHGAPLGRMVTYGVNP